LLLALGICLLVPAEQADAGCIHASLILQAKGNSDSAFFDLLPDTGAMPTGLDDLAAPPAPRKLPCPGGSCSRSPVVPLTPPATTAPSVNDLATLEQTPITAAPGDSPFTFIEPRDLPAPPALSIFHPPRLFPFA
jgi:hypothetical protein